MINKFILVDNCDNYYRDLIVFDKPVNKEELIKVIQNKKEELAGEYTNEDIYEAIDKLNVPYSILWLGNLLEIEY